MVEHLLNGDVHFWIVGEQSADQVFAVFAKEGGQVEISCFDLLKSLVDGRALKGWTAKQHHIEDAAYGPEVTHWPEALATYSLR